MIKRLALLFLMFVMVFCSAYKKPDKYVIRAEKDAYYHNNVGLNYLKDRIYYASIQEFKIAISLSPSTQASSIFYDNLGKTYNFIGYPDLALPCFEDAIKLYGLNLKYYFDLAETYKLLNLVEAKIKTFSASDDVYDRIKLGILYIENNELRKGVNILDEFCIQEPDLIITPAIRQYLKEVTSKIEVETNE